MYEMIENDLLPEELKEKIENYVEALSSGILTLSESEMYRMDILTELNFCKRENLLSPDVIYELKKYYVKGGILKKLCGSS